MKLTEITFPRYNLDKLPPDAMNSRKIEYYSLSGIPEDYVRHAPDFDTPPTRCATTCARSTRTESYVYAESHSPSTTA